MADENSRRQWNLIAQLEAKQKELDAALRGLDDANARYHDLTVAAGIKLYSLPDSHEDIVARIQELRANSRRLPSDAVVARIRAYLPSACEDPLCDFESCHLDDAVHAWLKSLGEDLFP